MHELRINEDRVLLYETIKELPIKRYIAFQRFLLIESGVGSDLESIGTHFAKLFQLLSSNLAAEALQETKNLYYNFYLMLGEIHPLSNAFGCLVAKINDEPREDYSEAGLQKTVERLQAINLTIGHITQFINDVKKKLNSELKVYFPDLFEDAEEMQFYQNVKARILIYERLIEDETDAQALRVLTDIDLFLAKMNKPACFDSDSAENAEVQLEIQFENLCSSLEGNGVLQASNLSVFEFYARLAFLKKQTAAIRAPRENAQPKA